MFVLYHPSSGRYVSRIAYSRKTKQYEVKFTYRFPEAKVWNSKAAAETQFG